MIVVEVGVASVGEVCCSHGTHRWVGSGDWARRSRRRRRWGSVWLWGGHVGVWRWGVEGGSESSARCWCRLLVYLHWYSCWLSYGRLRILWHVRLYDGSGLARERVASVCCEALLYVLCR